MQAVTGCRWALAALVVVASLAGARLLQGTAVGASLNARVYAVVHAFAQVTVLRCVLQMQPRNAVAGTLMQICVAFEDAVMGKDVIIMVGSLCWLHHAIKSW